MKPTKEQIEAWAMTAGLLHRQIGPTVQTHYMAKKEASLAKLAELACTAGRRSGIEEAANLLRDGWYKTLKDAENAIRAAMEADK